MDSLIRALAGAGTGDAAFCAALLPRVSRTFALSIAALPAALRSPVEAAYLLCRIVDSIEDDATLDGSGRATLFDAFDAALAGTLGAERELEALSRRSLRGVADAEQELCRGAGAVFRRHRALPAEQRAAIAPRVAAMSRGMREHALAHDDAGAAVFAPFADVPALERYCYFVAGTVGELLTDLFLLEVRPDEERARALAWRAVAFGTGLQLVNILKDVAADHARGICYLPRDLAAAQELELPALLAAEQRPAALRALAALDARARAHLDQAAAYTLLWPAATPAVRGFCAAPLALALATLREVARGTDTVVPGRTPKVPRPEALRLFAAAHEAAGDNAALRRLLVELGASGLPA